MVYITRFYVNEVRLVGRGGCGKFKWEWKRGIGGY